MIIVAKADQGMYFPAPPAKAGGNSWLPIEISINILYLGNIKSK